MYNINGLKDSLQMLQNNEIGILKQMTKIQMSNSISGRVISKRMDDLLTDIENQCIKARVVLEKFRPVEIGKIQNGVNDVVSEIAGSLEITDAGWLHITLNTLLPNCRHRISNYIGDTISRLIESYGAELPFFDTAFLGIVEYCSYKNHNALDNDNKGWKMIPNALKGRVFEDDSQFCLSIGLFSKLSEDLRCEIYVMPLEDASEFVERLYNDML